MVKPRQKHIAAGLSDSNNIENFVEKSSHALVDSELQGEDSWVTIRKQKVTVLIPRLPSTVQCLLTNGDFGQGQLHGDKPGNVTSIESELRPEMSPEVCPSEKNDGPVSPSPESNSMESEFPPEMSPEPEVFPSEENDGPVSASPESNSELGREVQSPPDDAVALPDLRRPDTGRQNVEEQPGNLRAFSRKKGSPLKYHGVFHSPSKAFEQSRQSGISDLSSSTHFFTKMKRASILKRKIVKAGGLRRWLSSMGLEQFERMFRGRSVSTLQLANMSMEKLKDMGADAVGPRRKLIHAIDCFANQVKCLQHE